MTARALAALLLAVALAVAGCASGEDSAGTGDGTPVSAAPTTGTTTPTGAGSATKSAIEVVIAVKDGMVSPPTHRVKIAKGATVRLLITSDVDDEVHVHGYDVEKELPAGQQADVQLVADQAGLFEVETHESGIQLVQLEVR